ncbi:MAG: CHAT domain-containing protein [Pirellulaceae bacterium]|nr:CHAT domain-containing protein [Pirellulaceae bacterium]
MFRSATTTTLVWMLACCAFAIQPPTARAQASSLEAALPLVRQSGDERALTNMLIGAAMQHMQAGRTDQAAERIDEAITLCRKTANNSELKTALLVATQLLNKMDDDAARFFLTGLLKEESDHPEIEIVVLKAIGDALLQSGNLVPALQAMHQHCTKIAEVDPLSDAEATALHAYGRTCLQAKMFDLGLPALEKAKQIADKTGNTRLAGLCQASIGNTCLRTGELETARDLFAAQLISARKNGDEIAESQGRASLMTAFIMMGDNQGATKLLENTLADLKGIDRGTMQGFGAAIAAAQGDCVTAATLANQSIESKLSVYPAAMRSSTGGMLIASDALALAHYELQNGNWDEASKAVEQSEDGYAKLEAGYRAAANLGAVSQDASLAALSFAAAGISNVRQQILVQRKQFDQALLESERGRGQVQAKAMRATFNAQIDDLSEPQSIQAIRELAAKQNVTFVEYSLIHSLDPMTRELLPRDSKDRLPNALYVWVVPPTGDVVFRSIPLDRSLPKMVDEFRLAILPPKSTAKKSASNEPPVDSDAGQESSSPAPPARTVAQTGSDLYDVLIAPIQSALPKDPEMEVVVIPQGELYAVPFIAIPTSDGKDLIDHHTLTTAASIELYRLSVQCHRPATEFAKEQILIVGNPDMPASLYRPDKPAEKLSPLPGAEREAKRIAEMFGIEPIVGKQATETLVKDRMNTARVIHLASHGSLEAENIFSRSYLSAIALTPSEDDDGFLTVREIMRMKLDAELVILSACNSGMGHVTGEGVVGLSRAYLTAGVPTVVVSLWPVSDQATETLMVTFYKALGQGKSKAAALRIANLVNRHHFKNPKLWAPFTLYGIGK